MPKRANRTNDWGSSNFIAIFERFRLHILVLAAFAFQPLYELLGRNPTFFIAHEARPIDMFLFVLFLQLIIPALLLLSVAMLGMIGEKTRRLADAGLVAFFLILIISPFLMRDMTDMMQATTDIAGFGGAVFLAYCAILSVILAAAYIRYSPIRLFLIYSSPAIIIFPALFLLNSGAAKSVHKMAARSVAKPQVSVGIDNEKDAPPIILIIFDEFPTASLMGPKGHINGARYPNFAKLAENAHWFRNAATVHAETRSSIASILTGKYPEHNPDAYLDYPVYLYSLLEHTYDMNIQEQLTGLHLMLKPDGALPTMAPILERMKGLLSDSYFVYLHIVLPPELTGGLPDVTMAWSRFLDLSKWRKKVAAARRGKCFGFDRISHFRDFIGRIRSRENPTLYVYHSSLPHAPYEYLPSGRTYGPRQFSCIAQPGQFQWGRDSWAVIQGYQRHLAQVAAVDLLLGELIDKLKAEGIYDRALLIITADHGASLWPEYNLRRVSESHYSDILSVPLFLKLPGQKKGAISDRKVQHVDILPTIAVVAGIRRPLNFDGRHLLDSSIPDRASQIIHEHEDNALWTFSDIAKNRNITIKRKNSLFGAGDSQDRLFTIGPHAELIRKQTDEIGQPLSTQAAVAIDDADLFDDVNMGGPFIPCLISGRLFLSKEMNNPVSLLVVVNGTVYASTQTYIYGKDAGCFSALVPEDAFHKGRNSVEILIASGSDGGTVLLRPDQRTK